MSFPDATGEPWEPANYEGRFHGPVTLQEALEDSINVATIKLLSEVKPNRVVRYARRLGIESFSRTLPHPRPGHLRGEPHGDHLGL